MSIDDEIYELATTGSDPKRLHDLGREINRDEGLGGMARAMTRVADRAEPDTELAMKIEAAIDRCWSGIGEWGS